MWRRVYGFWPPSWRAWVAIIVHDWGYWTCAEMDGPTGKHHPDLGARIVARICSVVAYWDADNRDQAVKMSRMRYNFWWKICAAHSRYYAEIAGIDPSPFMVPDKLATALLPRWLYALQVWLSGEYKEYVAYAIERGHDVPRDPWGYAGWLQANWREQFDVKHTGG
jgi:hypothetical protein